ncbi:hypothetical protein VIGAN_03196700, partial [Vigna angularis var. angularis]
EHSQSNKTTNTHYRIKQRTPIIKKQTTNTHNPTRKHQYPQFNQQSQSSILFRSFRNPKCNTTTSLLTSLQHNQRE